MVDRIAIVTGGSQGLGAEIVRSLSTAFSKIIIIDIVEPVLESSNVTFIQCDLSQSNIVSNYLLPKLKPFCNGRNVVLVNNAGCHASAYIGEPSQKCTSKFQPGDLTKRTFNVNFFTAVDLIEFLYDNLSHVVNIASVLSCLGLPVLSDYGSSKSALTAYHESLYFEIRKRKLPIKTTLVHLALMQTGLFKDIKNYPSWLLPVVEPKNVALDIRKAVVEGNSSDVICHPRYSPFVSFFFILRVLPLSILWRILCLLGIDEAMIRIRELKYGDN